MPFLFLDYSKISCVSYIIPTDTSALCTFCVFFIRNGKRNKRKQSYLMNILEIISEISNNSTLLFFFSNKTLIIKPFQKRHWIEHILSTHMFKQKWSWQISLLLQLMNPSACLFDVKQIKSLLIINIW